MEDKYAALLIDMQPGFFEKEDRQLLENLISSQIEFIKGCADNEIPIRVIEYAGEGHTFAQLKKEIKSFHEFEYYTKDSIDAFETTKLIYSLRKLKANHLILMGINANICVSGTGDGALEKGFKISSASDLIGNTRKEGPFNEDWYKENCEHYPETRIELLEIIEKEAALLR
jgi:nicotinamidase-related amidase